MSAATRKDDPPTLALPVHWLTAHRSMRHGRRRKALLFEGQLTNAGITKAPMTDADESPVGQQMPDAQHGEAPSLYCDRMDDKKKCCRCGRGTHLRFTRPGYPDVIAGYWKCRRCLTKAEKAAKAFMLWRDKKRREERLYRTMLKMKVEAGGLTD